MEAKVVPTVGGGGVGGALSRVCSQMPIELIWGGPFHISGVCFFFVVVVFVLPFEHRQTQDCPGVGGGGR